jgi:hypothetical protein
MLRKNLVVLSIFIIGTPSLYADWTKTFGGTGADYGYSICETKDSGFIITGHASSFDGGETDVYLIRTNSLGDTLWTKTFGGDSIDRASSVRQTSDGGFIIAGSTSSFGAGGVYLIKTDSGGYYLDKNI